MAIAAKTAQTDAQLRELGFDPAAAPEEAIVRLRSLRGTAGVSDITIARALGAIRSAEAATALAEMEPGASGTTRREIRRALFRLRQRGIEAPSSAPVPSRTDEPLSEVGLSALLSPGDADGARVAWLVKSRAGGGLRRLWGLVSESEGLMAARLETLSRKELRADRGELEKHAGTALIEADWRVVDFILCDAYRRTPETQRGRVGNFLAIRAELVSSAPPTELDHPIYKELAPHAGDEPSPDLIKEPEIASFKLPETTVKPYADEVAGLRESVIVLNRMQQEERINNIVERALTDLLVGDNAHRLRRHLEDSGYYFAHSGRRGPARFAMAAAAKIRDGAELRRIPFFQVFMRAQLGALLAEQQEQRQEEPRLIMTPAEAMRARQAAQARMRQRSR